LISAETSPVSALIKDALKLEKGSSTPNTAKVGKLTKAQVQKIAEEKIKDLNTVSLDAAMRIVAGSARSMGVTVEGM
jgi:large subunit ribosomal protein L11